MPPKSRPSSTSGNRRRMSKRSAASFIERLATPAGRTERPEYLDTPGPYTYAHDPDSRKIPYVFRTSERWKKTPAPLKDAIMCDRSAIEPKPKVVVFSTEQRWRPSKAPTSNTKVYDVEQGLQATEPKTFCATFNAGARKLGFLETPHDKDVASEYTPTAASEHYNTISATKVRGGVITGGQRNTLESFIRLSESPGPIYNPNFSEVEPASTSGVFSSQTRLPSQKKEGPSPLQYADSVVQEKHLSTSSRSPQVVFGSAPPSTAMPFPFNVHNVCNSRSMRTAFCVSSNATRSSDGAGTLDSKLNGSKSMERFNKAKKVADRAASVQEQGTSKWVERRRAVSAALRQSWANGSGLDVPFAVRPSSAALSSCSMVDDSDATLAEPIDTFGTRFHGEGDTSIHLAPDGDSSKDERVSTAPSPEVEEFPRPSTASPQKKPRRMGGGFNQGAYGRPTSAMSTTSANTTPVNNWAPPPPASDYVYLQATDEELRDMYAAANKARQEHRYYSMSPTPKDVGGEEMLLEDGSTAHRFKHAPKYPLKLDDEGYYSPEFQATVVQHAAMKRYVPQFWEKSDSIKTKNADH